MATKSSRCREFVVWAAEKNRQWYESREVKAGEWASCLWHFVRIIRFQPYFETRDPAEVADEVEAELCNQLKEEGHEDEVDPWSWYFDFDIEVGSRDSFIGLWPKVQRRIELDDPLESARIRTDEESEWIYTKTTSTKASVAPYRRFISIAAHLQLLIGNETPVALPVERLAEILGVDRQRVGMMRENAVTDGILTSTSPPSQANRKAAKYLVNLGKLERRYRGR